jgi:hypothetical protein
MTPHEIPERSTSRYAGQYAQSIDPQRLLEIFTDSRKIALNSKDPATAGSRFELAVEAYHQLMSVGLASDPSASLQDAMTSLADQFPIQVCLNEALGLYTKAGKLKTAPRKLEYLHRARDVLRAWLATNGAGAIAIQTMHDQVLADIIKAEAVAGAPRTITEK